MTKMTFIEIKANAGLVGAPNFRRTSTPCCYHCAFLVWDMKGVWRCKEHGFVVSDSNDWLADAVCDSFVLDHGD
jgi:hypothetical protein